MTIPYYQISRDAADALRRFDDSMRSALALADVNVWSKELGFGYDAESIKTTFPLPVSAPGFSEWQGDRKFRRLYSRSLSMTTKKYEDGVEELAEIIEAPDFIDWPGEPARMAQEWLRLPNELVVTLLALGANAGPLLDFYRDPDTDTASARRMFATDHPYNVFKTSLGSFNNLSSVTTTVAKIENGEFFKDVEDHFTGIKGPNGKDLGLSFLDGGRILGSRTYSNSFREILQQDTLIRTVDAAGAVNPGASAVAAVTQKNPYQGVSWVPAVEMSQTTYLYCFAAAKAGLHAWVVQQQSALNQAEFDKSSEYYKRTGKVAISYDGLANVAGALPHPILRVQVTG